MRDYQAKSNVGALPDSNDPTKLGGGEVSSLRTEAKTAVERTGLALAPQDGTAEDTTQLAQALMINGMSASTFQTGGTANAITLTPVTGATGLLLPPDYSTLDGMKVTFFAGFNNTAATTFSIGQTGGTQFGIKKILDEAGADLSGGEITAGSRIDIIYDASADGGSGAAILRVVSVVPDASTTVKGIAELATSAETQAGVDAIRIVTPAGLVSLTSNTSRRGLVEQASNAEAADGTDITRFITPFHLKTYGHTTLATRQTTTTGTFRDFTSIPAGTKRITIGLVGVSTNGTSGIILQLGDSGGLETSGYLGASAKCGATGNTQWSSGCIIYGIVTAGFTYHGEWVITLIDDTTDTWVISSKFGLSDQADTYVGGGSKVLSAVLDRVRLTTVGGTDTFDAGFVNIAYE